jgi:hypothetical protein
MLVNVDFTSITSKPDLPHQKISNGFYNDRYDLIFTQIGAIAFAN